MEVPPQNTPRMPASHRLTCSAKASSNFGVVKSPLTLRCFRMVAAWSTTWAMYCLATSYCLFDKSFFTKRGSRSMK